MNHSPSTDLNHAKALIDGLDLTSIIDRVIQVEHWTEKQALEVCQLYRNYLFLRKKYGQRYETLPPSEDIDEFWHNHILDTQKYQKDCQVIFGEYLHHYPYFGIDGKITKKDLYEAFEMTQQLHLQEFGDYIYKVKKNGSVKQFLKFLTGN
jgi:hypothetical protein